MHSILRRINALKPICTEAGNRNEILGSFWNEQYIVQDKISSVAAAIPSRQRAVANVSSLNTLTLLCSGNGDIALPLRDKITFVVENMSRRTSINNDVQ